MKIDNHRGAKKTNRGTERENYLIKINKERIFKIVLSCLLIAGITVIMNWDMRLKGIYRDDYDMWTRIGVSGTIDYIFNLYMNKIRPIPHAVMLLAAKIASMEPVVLGYFLLALHAGMTVLIYLIALMMTDSFLVSFCIAITYQTSRFSYYHVTQYLGIMESAGAFFAIGMLVLLYVALEKKRLKSELVCLAYVCAAFSHERYLVLFPVLLYAAVCFPVKKRGIKLAVEAGLSFVFILSVRFILFGGRAFDGTAGTDIKDTFRVGQALGFAFSHLWYLFGWNDGPRNLNGYMISEYSELVRWITIVMDISIVLFCAVFVVILLRYIKERNYIFKNIGLFILFIAACIASASTTIRLEMRWIYVSFTAMLLLIAYIYSVVKKIGCIQRESCIILSLICLYCGTCCWTNAELRKGWNELYYADDKQLTDSLYDYTYGKFGDSFWDKDLLIVYDRPEDVEQTRKWLSAFPGGYRVESMRIEGFGCLREINNYNGSNDRVILYRDTEQYADFSDFFDIMHEDKIVLTKGIELDSWIHQNAEFEVHAKNAGYVYLYMYTNQAPDESWNSRMVNVYANDNLVGEINMSEQYKEFSFHVDGDQVTKVRIENNFVDPNVVREGIPFCYTLSIEHKPD